LHNEVSYERFWVLVSGFCHLTSDIRLLSSGIKVLGSMLAKLIEFIGLAELIISTNQPFNPINHQALTFVYMLSQLVPLRNRHLN
jgi:hypothetical protein